MWACSFRMVISMRPRWSSGSDLPTAGWCERAARSTRVIRKWSVLFRESGICQTETDKDGVSSDNLQIPKHGNTLTNYYILPDFRGEPRVGAGVFRHQCRSLPEETHPQTHPGHLTAGMARDRNNYTGAGFGLEVCGLKRRPQLMRGSSFERNKAMLRTVASVPLFAASAKIRKTLLCVSDRSGVIPSVTDAFVRPSHRYEKPVSPG